MKTSDFFFELPEELIAQTPIERGMSRLMVIGRKNRSLDHRMINELPGIIEKGSLMVFNNSKVRRARLAGVSEETGAKVEFLLVDRIDKINAKVNEVSNTLWRVMVQRAKRRRIGSRYLFGNRISEIVAFDGEFCVIKFDRPVDDAWLDINGHVPLPPYIKRNDTEADAERYQTVYAKEFGSAAAPTAGLHFTRELLEGLNKAGVETAFITLHVGLGTFLPVRSKNVEDHKMHDEAFFIDEKTASQIEKAKTEGRSIVAVGTTSVRTLESAWAEDPSQPAGGKLQSGAGNCSIFIYPPYAFKVVSALLTNFHTPCSSLLMLISAFAGRDLILDSYKEAIREGYRFFSYGDACLIL